MTKLKNFDENTSFNDLSKFMRSFKKFAENELGKKISVEDLSLNKMIDRIAFGGRMMRLASRRKNLSVGFFSYLGSRERSRESRKQGHISGLLV